MLRSRRLALGRVRDAALTRFEYARRAGRGEAKTRVVCVLGMHRSGTSILAGTLQEAGLYLGSVLRKHADNAKGTREHLEIVELHDAILAYSGGSWSKPPDRVEWTDEHRRARDRIVRSFAGAQLWGFKDPRTLLLLDFWREALDDSLELVGVFREPGEVARSLLGRDGGTATEWLALWARHNEELLRLHGERPFPLIEFSDDPTAYRDQIVPALRVLGLRVPATLRFFDRSLPGSGRVDVPPAAEELYQRLRVAQRLSSAMSSLS